MATLRMDTLFGSRGVDLCSPVRRAHGQFDAVAELRSCGFKVNKICVVRPRGQKMRVTEVLSLVSNVVGRENPHLQCVEFPTWPRIVDSRVGTSFSGQHVRRQSRNYSVPSRRMKTTVKAQQENHVLNASSLWPNNSSSLGTEHILDDLSRYIYRKISKALSPYVPKDFDALDWLPESLHKRVHKGEYITTVAFAKTEKLIPQGGFLSLMPPFRHSTSSIPSIDRIMSTYKAWNHPWFSFLCLSSCGTLGFFLWVLFMEGLKAVFVLREAMHFALFYFLFTNVERFCKWLNWLYITNMKTKDVTGDGYEASSFKAMTDPMRLLVGIWAATRLAHLSALLFKLNLGLGVTGKARSIGLVVAVTWFFFKWKQLYVDHLASRYRLDAPRILAFDKVVSLLMYFVAASCIGEVTGFALRSLLAVGGFSGIALGLAAKEVVSNFFGGAILFLTRPFVIGERIKAGNCSGYVQDIGFLQTKILSLDRMPVVVPNQAFINQVITNYSRANNKLLDAEFPLRIQDVTLVDRITSRVVKYLRSHPDVDVNKSAPVCYLKSLNSSGIILAVTCVVRPPGGSEFYRVQQAILVRTAEIITLEGASLGGTAPFGPEIPEVVPGIVGS